MENRSIWSKLSIKPNKMSPKKTVKKIGHGYSESGHFESSIRFKKIIILNVGIMSAASSKKNLSLSTCKHTHINTLHIHSTPTHRNIFQIRFLSANQIT